MKNRIATLKDIADKLDLSISTVSRAISDHPDISEKTKARVMKLVKKLDYQPNQLAINLLNQQSNSIGVIVPSIGYYLYATAISGIEQEAEKHGLKLIICQSNESAQRESEIINELVRMRVAGIIVSVASGGRDFSHFKRIVKRVPLVFFNRDCSVRASKVMINNHKAAYDLTQHLIETGKRNIAYLAGPKTLQISNKREKGYLDCLSDFGIESNDDWVCHSPFTQMSALNMVDALIKKYPRIDALIAFSDQLAMGAMKAIKKHQKSIPDDIAIAGFNNEPADELLEPPLTSIEQPAFEMGRKAAELLLKQMHQEGKLHEQVVLNSSLIVRKSTWSGNENDLNINKV